MNIEIRTATTSDLPQLVSLLQQLSLEPQREDPAAMDRYEAALAEVLADRRQTILVAFNDQAGAKAPSPPAGRGLGEGSMAPDPPAIASAVVGTATLVIVPNLSHVGRPYAIVENVVVDAAARDRGIGEALMHDAIERARNAGCYKIALTSNRVRADAHRFYERLGFTASHVGLRIEF